VSLVTLAPKTNVAMLLTKYPEVAARVEKMIFMGGSASGGNTTTVAEFNVWQDPEAARRVIESSIPTTMYPFELFSRLAVSQGVADRFRAHDHPAIRLVGNLLHRRRTSSHGTSHDQVGLLGDAGAMVLLTNPELFITRELLVQVALDGIGRGQTVVDHQAGRGCTAVALDLDAAQAASAFVKVIDGYAA
jgi:pyrimidine-specific ribonucleoside hydrolase